MCEIRMTALPSSVGLLSETLNFGQRLECGLVAKSVAIETTITYHCFMIDFSLSRRDFWRSRAGLANLHTAHPKFWYTDSVRSIQYYTIMY